MAAVWRMWISGCNGDRLTTLDISDLSKLLMIRCSNQTSDGAAMQTLTLTLAAAPRAQSVEHHSRVHGRRTLPVDAVICFEHLRFGVPIG